MFRWHHSGPEAPPLAPVLSLMLVSPRLFFYHNQTCYIFARSICLQHRPGGISPLLKSALLMVTHYRILSRASIIWTQVTFSIVSFYPAALEMANTWHIHHHAPPLAQVFIQWLVVEIPTVCMDSVKLQEYRRRVVPDRIELMAQWRRQAINEKINELW